MYKQIHERAGISIEQDTDKVPNDHHFYVLKNGEIAGKYRSFKQADKIYKSLVVEKNLPPLEREPIQKSITELLKGDWDRRSNTALLGMTWRPKQKGRRNNRLRK